ncbi:MAG: hypothetical protein Q8O67_31490 [Deltaproteobacteria bacterium]|nr:hypothetical protein [Deltaproteobacteria bacterium]
MVTAAKLVARVVAVGPVGDATQILVDVDAALAAGEDLAALREPLVQAARLSTNVYVQDPLVTAALKVAAVVDALPATVLRLVVGDSRYAFLQVLPRVAAGGVDVDGVLPLVFERLSQQERESLLGSLLLATPARAAALVDLARAAGLSAFVVAGVIGTQLRWHSKVELDPVAGPLRLMLRASETAPTRVRAVEALAVLAAREREPWTPIEDLVDDDDADVAAAAARPLLFRDAADPAASMAHWLTDSRAWVRVIALNALAVRKAPREVLRASIAGLADVDDAVRAAAFLRFVTVEACDPAAEDASVLAPLAPLLAAEADVDVVVARALARLCSSPPWATAVLALLDPRAASPAARRARLRAVVERAAAGDVRGCLVCERISRYIGYEHADGLSYAREKLVPPLPGSDSDAFSSACPNCAVTYIYSSSTEYDVNSAHVSTTLRRVPFAVSGLSKDERATRSAVWQQDLRDPRESVAREAAWNLEALARAEGRFDDVKSLLQDEDDVVRAEAATAYAAAHALGQGSDVATAALVALVSDPAPAVRRLAGAARTRELIAQQGPDDAVDALLRDDNDDVLLGGLDAFALPATEALDRALVRLLPLLARPALRSWLPGLLRPRFAGPLRPEHRAVLLELMAGPREVRDGAFAVASVITTAEPAFVAAVVASSSSSPLSWTGLELLATQATLGADLTAAVPALGESIALHPSQSAFTALAAFARRPGGAELAVRALLRTAGGTWNSTMWSSLNTVADAGVDLASVDDALRAALPDCDGYGRYVAVRLLLKIAKKRGTEREWLEHADPEIARTARGI